MKPTRSTLDAISAGRVSQRRQWSDRNAQDCYQYTWLLDGKPAPARMVRELGSLYAEAAIVPGTFGIGAGEVGVTVR